MCQMRAHLSAGRHPVLVRPPRVPCPLLLAHPPGCRRSVGPPVRTAGLSWVDHITCSSSVLFPGLHGDLATGRQLRLQDAPRPGDGQHSSGVERIH
eukprot:COSAG02_NODE_14_length_56855_cov_512.793661_44_plen_96_part_00